MNEEVLAAIKELTNLQKKTNELLRTIGKAMHLVPMTEKEVIKLQETQRKNLYLQNKVYEELNTPVDVHQEESIEDGDYSVYNDIIGDDYLGGM